MELCLYSNQHLCMCIRRVLPDGSIGICACFLYSWERTARLAPLHMISICIDLLDSLHMISICISVRRAPPDALPLIIGMCADLGSKISCVVRWLCRIWPPTVLVRSRQLCTTISCQMPRSRGGTLRRRMTPISKRRWR